MAKQIPAYPDKKSISDLVGKIRRNELILQPEFQRKFVWTDEHMEKFIETILGGYPFPEIYISQKGIDLDTLATQNVIVDGQQRITTIMRYIDGNHKFKRVPKFEDLTPPDKEDFLNYDVTVRDLKDALPSTIIDIFSRINSTNFTVNAVEINQAVYDGEFMQCAKDILNKINSEEIKIDVFSESELTRMADLHFILLVLSTIEEGGYFFRDKEVEKYIALYNESYDNRDKNASIVSTIIVNVLKSNISDDSIWFRKSNFFTLIVELYFQGIYDVESILASLNSFEDMVVSYKNYDKSLNDYSLYYSNMYTGTNSRQARVIRSELFRKYVLNKT